MSFAKVKNTLYTDRSALFKNSVILFVGSMAINALNYLYHLVIGRQVGAEVYGQTEALFSLMNIIAVPAATLTMVATKYVAACKAEDNKKGSHEIMTYLNRKVLFYGVPIFLAAIAVTPFIGNYLNITNRFALMLVWLAMLISFFGSVNAGILSGWQKFKDINTAGIAGTLAKLFFGIVLVKIGLGLNGIVASVVLAGAATYAATLFALRFIMRAKQDTVPESCTAVDFNALKKYVIPAFVGNLAITILSNADMVMAKHSLDDVQAGQYGALTIVSKIIFFATGIVTSVLFTMAAENHHKGESSRRNLYVATALVAAGCLVATMLYFLFPEIILGLLFGAKYQSVAGQLGWFAVSVGFFSLANLMLQYLLSLHRTSASYAFLAVALGMLGAVSAFGGSIRSIIMVVIAAQCSAVCVGGYFLVRSRRSAASHH